MSLPLILTTLYQRDLKRLITELELYQDEANIWKTEQQIANSAGNLCLHLVGNLNTYIGAGLGHTGYIRNRPEEFSLRNIPRPQLIAQINETIGMVGKILPAITDTQLNDRYPREIHDDDTSTAHFLVHLAIHLGYHLGQVNYHRRLLDR